MTEPIKLIPVAAGITELRLDAPDGRNALDATMIAALLAALGTLATDNSLKVLLLSGRPDVFCSGATLNTLDELAAGRMHIKDLELPDRLLAFPVPIIAALAGAAVGGGLALALCCDVTVAAADRRYGFNFTDLGFTPGMGVTALLPAQVGHGLASEMLLSGKYYRGRDLQHAALFTHVVPAEEVAPLATDIALRMAEKPRHVLSLTRQTLNTPRRQALLAAQAAEHRMHEICFAAPETVAQIRERYLPAG